MKIEVKKFETLPEGTYAVTFEGLEAIETEKGEALRWKFVIARGVFRGREVKQLTASYATTKNNCGKMLKDLAGSLTADTDTFVGKEFFAKIGINDRNYNTVTIIGASEDVAEDMADTADQELFKDLK